MVRWLLLVLILAGMLVAPIWLKRSYGDKDKGRAGTDAAISKPAPVPAAVGAAPVKGPRQIGYGLTFALRPSSDKIALGVASVSCDGEPKPSDKRDKDACNPLQGDTSCNFLLPMLCLKPGAFVNPAPPGANPVGSWISSTLSATAPVMGAILESQETADARHEKDLGAGYRMAGRYAGGDGMALRGRPGQGLGVSGATRYWVATKGELGNRWGTARLDALAAQQLCST